MTYIFIDSLCLDKCESLLLDFEKNIFIHAFPDPDERESFEEDIIPRIKDSGNPLLRTYCTLALDDNGDIAGGVVADWYPGCQALEIIYITVDPARRGGSIGRLLLDNGIENIRNAVKRDGKEIKAIFLEVDIPTTVSEDKSSMNPVDRLKVWDAWGARRIPINYTQPPLSEGKLPVSNLMLMCLTAHGTDIVDAVPATLLKDFLKDFYIGLDAQNSECLDEMCEDIDLIATDGRVDLSPLKEITHATISNSDITTHFSVQGEIGISLPETCNSFNSYECDLMNHINQRSRPFKTKFVKLMKEVEVSMPPFYCYTSEGVTHYRLSQNTCLKADISISVSVAADNDIKPLAHVTIVPSEGQAFNNLDYTKFITNFGSRQEQYCASCPISFSISGKQMTFEELLKDALRINDGRVVMIGEGATQFDICGIKPLPAGNYEEGEFYVDDFFTTRFEPEGKITEILINKIFCGLILGIFDYQRMNNAEIEDTIRPIVKASDSFFVACRGHIFKVEEAEKDVRSAYPKILISPYLLVPCATLAFNGLALDECEELIKTVVHKRFSPNVDKMIRRAEVILNVEYIENIFHYNSEQEIIREGNRQRCMADRYVKLNKQIEIIKKRINKSSDIIMEGLLAVVAIFGVIEVFSKDMEWNTLIVLMIIGLFAIELVRWYKTRNISDL